MTPARARGTSCLSRIAGARAVSSRGGALPLPAAQVPRADGVLREYNGRRCGPRAPLRHFLRVTPCVPARGGDRRRRAGRGATVRPALLFQSSHMEKTGQQSCPRASLLSLLERRLNDGQAGGGIFARLIPDSPIPGCTSGAPRSASLARYCTRNGRRWTPRCVLPSTRLLRSRRSSSWSAPPTHT